MDEILKDLPGVTSIHDDVCVYGKDEEEHDRNLKGLMDRAEARGLVLNSEKCDIRKAQISFFGNICSAEGIKPDPEKVKAIKQMRVPQTKEDLQKFLGIMTYIASFIPNFSDKSQPIRDLPKKDTPFVLHEDHINCFNELKAILSSEACLAYYYPKKPVTLEMDASQKGVGVALFQNNRPVALHQKRLIRHRTTTQTLTEKCWQLCLA